MTSRDLGSTQVILPTTVQKPWTHAKGTSQMYTVQSCRAVRLHSGVCDHLESFECMHTMEPQRRRLIAVMYYRSGMVNSNTVNSKFHLIQSLFEILARILSFHV